MTRAFLVTSRSLCGNPLPQCIFRLTMAVLLAVLASGCTAVTNPVADGIPTRLVPQELLATPKAGSQTLPLCALGQPQPDVYRLDAGDVLAVFVDGFLGDRNQPLPIHVAPVIQDQNRPPVAGYPVRIEEDGTIALPGVPQLVVRGLTVGQARQAIYDLYVKKELIRADNNRILVTLLQPRQTQVLVFRQEAQLFQVTADGPEPVSRRNTGRTLELPAYENDVLHALVRSGGLPEPDAYNEIIIYRGGCHDAQVRLEILRQLENARPGCDPGAQLSGAVGLVQIPLRLPCGAPLPISPPDVLLHPGDIVFLEARDEQVYFTAGLLPPGKHVLPRDQDLDVLEAVAQVHGSLYNGAFGGSNLSGLLINPGLGNPSPSLLVVLRRGPNGGYVPIAVDLREALRHPQERLLLRPGDILLLQEKPAEALARFFTQTFFNFDLFWTPFHSANGAGVIDIAAPDRLPSRVGSVITQN